MSGVPSDLSDILLELVVIYVAREAARRQRHGGPRHTLAEIRAAVVAEAKPLVDWLTGAGEGGLRSDA